MKLEEAIEILVLDKACEFEGSVTDLEDALQLGIEALNLIDNLRFDGSPYYPKLLLSETEE